MNASAEQRRLAALARYQIMDSPGEAAFDDITTLATRYLQTPIALVSLLDDQRQWFKSRVGLDVCETPRDLAFCAHAIRADQLLVVENANEDPRFRDNPLVTGEPHICFYAGMPVHSAEGYPLGTLCVIDRQPRTLDAQQRDTLIRLAGLVEQQLRLRLQLLEGQEREMALSEQKALNASLLESMMVGVVACDAKGQLTLINRTARDWHGVDILDVPPEHWWRYYDLYQSDEVTPLAADQVPLWRALSGEQLTAVSFCIAARGQPVRHLQASGGPLYDAEGRFKGAMVAMLDITERRQIEQMKSRFIATVSHELRTPLTSISGAIALLLGGAGGDLPEAGRRMLGIAQDNTQRLQALINDLLDIERLESGLLPLKLSVQPLLPLLQRAIDSNQLYAERFNVSLVLLPPSAELHLICDAERLLQVMDNLLSNAAKFSHAGDSIVVDCRVIDDQVQVQVTDQGVGIAMEQQSRLFQRFFQIDDSTSRKRGGTGLGLAISKELVERMGGSIGVDSQAGQGACFWFRLPLASSSDRGMP